MTQQHPSTLASHMKAALAAQDTLLLDELIQSSRMRLRGVANNDEAVTSSAHFSCINKKVTFRIAEGSPERYGALIGVGQRSSSKLQAEISEGLYEGIDLFVYTYDSVVFNSSLVKGILNAYPITKTLAFYLLMQQLKAADQATYAGWMLFDDDLKMCEFMPFDFMSFCVDSQIDIAQPSLRIESCFNWYSLTTSVATASYRAVSACEVMTPFYSKKIVDRYWSLFKAFSSCWGIDVLISRLAFSQLGTQSYVIDKFQILHFEKSDSLNGPFYTMLRSHFVNPRDQLELALRYIETSSNLFTEI